MSWLGDVAHENPNRVGAKFWFLDEGAQLYSNSKLCNTIAADGFAARLSKYNVTSNSVRPFLVTATRILSESEDAFLKFWIVRLLVTYLLSEVSFR